MTTESKKQQEPWTEGSIVGEFYFKPGAVATTVKPEPLDNAAQVEQQGWAAAQSGNTVAGYTAYLQEHPQGRLQSCSPANSPGLPSARQGLQAAKRIRVGVRGAGRPEHSAIPIP